MQVENKINTITKTITVEEPVLVLTLTVEEAKALLALGFTSNLMRREFLEESSKGSMLKPTFETNDSCASLLGEFYYAAHDFLVAKN